MKGVIASLCPAAQLIDLTHEIPPQNIAEARFNLLSAYPYFPQGTVHLVVVDPGVGTERRAIALQTPRGYLVGPDNGVLSGILDEENEIAAVELTDKRYWRSPNPSHTFHGRDIFAPVAAHLASGVALTQLGDEIDPAALVRFPIPEPKVTTDQVTGHVQHVDHFGNLVTTISASVAQQQNWQIRVGGNQIPLGQTYGDAEPGQAIALIGSHNYLEIAINGGSARADLNLAMGDAVQLTRHP
jgi:hypothetical protein